MVVYRSCNPNIAASWIANGIVVVVVVVVYRWECSRVGWGGSLFVTHEWLLLLLCTGGSVPVWDEVVLSLSRMSDCCCCCVQVGVFPCGMRWFSLCHAWMIVVVVVYRWECSRVGWGGSLFVTHEWLLLLLCTGGSVSVWDEVVLSLSRINDCCCCCVQVGVFPCGMRWFSLCHAWMIVVVVVYRWECSRVGWGGSLFVTHEWLLLLLCTGGSVPVWDEVVLSLSRMNDCCCCCVQVGVFPCGMRWFSLCHAWMIVVVVVYRWECSRVGWGGSLFVTHEWLLLLLCTGGSVPVWDEVVLSLSRMNDIISIDKLSGMSSTTSVCGCCLAGWLDCWLDVSMQLCCYCVVVLFTWRIVGMSIWLCAAIIGQWALPARPHYATRSRCKGQVRLYQYTYKTIFFINIYITEHVSLLPILVSPNFFFGRPAFPLPPPPPPPPKQQPKSISPHWHLLNDMVSADIRLLAQRRLQAKVICQLCKNTNIANVKTPWNSSSGVNISMQHNLHTTPPHIITYIQHLHT